MANGLNLATACRKLYILSHVPVIKMQSCYTVMCTLTIASLLHWFLFTSSLSVQQSIFNRIPLFPFCTCQVYTCVHVHKFKRLIDERVLTGTDRTDRMRAHTLAWCTNHHYYYISVG